MKIQNIALLIWPNVLSLTVASSPLRGIQGLSITIRMVSLSFIRVSFIKPHVSAVNEKLQLVLELPMACGPPIDMKMRRSVCVWSQRRSFALKRCRRSSTARGIRRSTIYDVIARIARPLPFSKGKDGLRRSPMDAGMNEAVPMETRRHCREKIAEPHRSQMCPPAFRTVRSQ